MFLNITKISVFTKKALHEVFSVCVFCDYSYFLFIFFYYFSGIVEQPGRKEEEAFKDAIETTLDDSDENIS